MLALFIFGDRRWPEMQLLPVVWLTVLFGTGYAIVSEWLNITVRKAWAYSDLMPVVPLIDTGLSPLLRWIVIPLGGFWWASRINPQPLEKTL
jgi:hypothetical protein